jgi:hypothetical protein
MYTIQYLDFIQCLTFKKLKVLKQLLAAGFIDQVAVRKIRIEGADGVQVSTSKGVPYKAMGISEDAFIHPSSVLANIPPPDYVIFSEVIRTSRIFLKGKQLSVLLDSMLYALFRSDSCQPILALSTRQAFTMLLFQAPQKQRWNRCDDPSIWTR